MSRPFLFYVERTSGSQRAKPCSDATACGVRSDGLPAWCVDVPTPEDMCTFVDDWGEIVVKACEFGLYDDESRKVIEIYDTYRE